jgi:hypothetical protein
MRPEHPAHGGVVLCTVQCRPASACARKSPPRGCTRRQDKTRQGREFRKLLQIYFETRRKATRGACYRWHYVVGNASVYVYVHWAKTARQSAIRPQPEFLVDPWLWTHHQPVLGACLPCLVCGLALNTTTATPTRTGLSRRPRPCAGDCVSVWFRSGGCWFCLSPSLLQHHHQARPASSLFWSCPLAH